MIDSTFPLIDLHRHLDGNVRLGTILHLGRRHNLQLPAWDIEGLRPHVQVTEPQPGVMAFIAKFKCMMAVLVDYGACRRVAYENVEDAQRESIDYVELRFSPWFMAESNGLNPMGVVEAVADGVEAGARDFGVKVNLIGILSRTYGVDIGWRELEALLQHRDRLVALDLAGDEANQPGALFVEHLQRARDAGWQVTIHAGEITGPESVWQAILDLRAARIGHAVRATSGGATTGPVGSGARAAARLGPGGRGRALLRAPRGRFPGDSAGVVGQRAPGQDRAGREHDHATDGQEHLPRPAA